MIKIQHEEKNLKQILQARVENLQREKIDMNQNLEMEGEYKINKLNSLMNKLVKEKQKLEEYYSYEVREKQELVLALAREKKNLTNELQALIKDVKKSKHKIKKHSHQVPGGPHQHYRGNQQIGHSVIANS